MKRNNKLTIALFLTIPLLVFACGVIGLIAYLTLNFYAATNETVQNSQAVRIRTIPELAPGSPAPVINEPVVEVEAAKPVEAPVEPVVSAPTLFETNDPIDVSTDPLPEDAEEETATALEVAPAPIEPAAPQAVPDTIVDNEPATETIEVVEEAPVIEIPAEPVKIEQRPLPEVAAHPVSASIPPEAPKSDFVPGSSFFDQLLDQLE